MTTIDVTFSWPPCEEPALRIDFSGEAISSREPYAVRNRKYWLDDLPFLGNPITRAQMLTQALRRIDGVGEIGVEQYALIVQVASTHLATKQTQRRIMAKIKAEISTALSALTPWATHCSNKSLWSYHFGARLVQSGHDRQRPVTSDSPHLTELAKGIVHSHMWKQVNLPIGDIWSHHLLVVSKRLVTVMQLSQAQLALSVVVGTRPDIKINWRDVQ